MIDSIIVVECRKSIARITSFDGVAIGFPLFLPRERLLLRNPFLKFSDGFTLHRKLDVGVDGIEFFAARMAYDCFADFLLDPGLHHSRIARVAEILGPVIADTRAAYSSLPSGFDNADGHLFEHEEKPRLS